MHLCKNDSIWKFLIERDLKEFITEKAEDAFPAKTNLESYTSFRKQMKEIQNLGCGYMETWNDFVQRTDDKQCLYCIYNFPVSKEVSVPIFILWYNYDDLNNIKGLENTRK